MYETTVKKHFSGAHYLREYNGECEKLHGHNWIVEATLCGENLDKGGMLLDFTRLKSALDSILDEFDHTLLNDHPEFKNQNPSAERIARYIFQRLKETIKSPGVDIKEVCVHESESSKAVYREK